MALGCAGMRLREAKDKVHFAEDIAYVQDGTHKHQLDLYVPIPKDELPTLAPPPTVLFVHGGFWKGQDRRYFQAFTGIYGNIGVSLARRGITTAVQSYRLHPPARIQDQIDDVLSALTWVQEHVRERGGDPTRIVLIGYSAGGHLVSMVGLDKSYQVDKGLDPSRVKGVVSISGLLDVPKMVKGQESDFNEEVSFKLFGRTEAEQAKLSPSSYLRPDAPPLLAFAAEKDFDYVRTAAKETTDRAKAIGMRASFEEIPNHDHSAMVLNFNSKSDQLSDKIAKFVHEVAPPHPQLKGDPGPPPRKPKEDEERNDKPDIPSTDR
jgi:arylformamidase